MWRELTLRDTRMVGSPASRPDLALGAQEKPRRRNSLRIKPPPAGAQTPYLEGPQGPLIFMSQRGRTTVRAIEGFFVGFLRSAPRINPPQPATKTDVPNEKADCRRDRQTARAHRGPRVARADGAVLRGDARRPRADPESFRRESRRAPSGLARDDSARGARRRHSSIPVHRDAEGCASAA